QINPLVGDVAGNTRRVLDQVATHRGECDLIVFPELVLTGYPPEDLLLHPDMRRQIAEALAQLRSAAGESRLLVGHPEYQNGWIYNACSLIAGGEIRAVYRKRELPNYGVFDEKRHFTPGSEPLVVDVAGLPIGVTICEDGWIEGPIADTCKAGARLMINVNASPYAIGKRAEREAVIAARAKASGVATLYLNLVGGQDELVFDGHSFVVDRHGEVIERMAGFREDFAVFRISTRAGSRGHVAGRVGGEKAAASGEEESEEFGAGFADDATGEPDAEVYQALTLAVHDYAIKNGFKGVLVGLSGGVDSALTLAIAVDALGAGQVAAVFMPSRYTSELSGELAKEQVRRLGVKAHTVSIEEPFQAFANVLKDVFAGLEADVTEENIQARCRGVILMAISNKTGKLVLTTGNKSEYATGYATLYGDMAGGFAPLKDVSKTLIYRLARYRNHLGELAPIPERVLTREPSAELAANQKDTDSLPPYPVLDAVLAGLVEKNLGLPDLEREGFDRETVQRIARLVKRSEYKRRQAPPGVKISPRAFGRERRYPITSGFRTEGEDRGGCVERRNGKNRSRSGG
ncbi:MAG TPA: NAD+ synthase, partial [Gammaproteobacteria bacterium]|nr:NAD+ synthase [Gammaproteobacteria bacterium]